MKYLAIDTSNTHVSIAVAVDERFFSATMPVVNGHSEETLPLIQRLLADGGIGLAELDAIIYGQGPGAFTGLRIGCGIAQGLALAHDLPLIPVPTLDVIAFQSGAPAVQVVMDARMNEVYTASYRDGVAQTPILEVPAQPVASELGRTVSFHRRSNDAGHRPSLTIPTMASTNRSSDQ